MKRGRPVSALRVLVEWITSRFWSALRLSLTPPGYLAFSLSNRSVVSAWGKVVRVDEAGQAGVRFTRLSRMDYQQILERIALESDAARLSRFFAFQPLGCLRLGQGRARR